MIPIKVYHLGLMHRRGSRERETENERVWVHVCERERMIGCVRVCVRERERGREEEKV